MTGLPPTFVKGFHNEEAVRKMTYQQLGKTGMLVSKLGFGGACFAPFFGHVEEDDAIRTIQNAIKNGVNYIDTAPYYGQGRSEQIIGKALKGVPREAYYIATKVARYGLEIPDQFDYSAERTRKSIETSLGYLGLDYVDVIQVHDVDFADSLDVVINETLPVLEEARNQGKARFIGFTGFTLRVLKEAILRAPGRIDVILNYSRYTMLDESLLEYLPFFLERNIGVICAAAHALGILTNRGPCDWHPGYDRTKQQGKLCAEYCKERGIELGKLAIWYTTQLKGASTFLVGMPTDEIVNINLDSISNGLSTDEKSALDYCMKNFCGDKSNWEGVEIREHRKVLGKNIPFVGSEKISSL